MSQSAGLEVMVVGMAYLLKAVVECGYEMSKGRQSFQTDDGTTHTVDLVVKDEHGAKVGVKVDKKTEAATFVPYDCKGEKGATLAKKIAQRYAYSKVVEELRRKGYTVGEEVKEKDGTVKLTASRWR